MYRAWLPLAALPFVACAAFAGVDQGLLNLVPPDSKVLSGVQVDKSKDSAFGQHLLSRMQDGDSGFENFVQSTGFDPRRDVQELLFATTGDPSQPHIAVIARGYFDAERIKATAVAHGSHIETIQGISVILNGEKSHGGVAVLEPTIAVAGDRALVESIVKNRKQPSVLDSPELAEKAQTASSAGEAWFVSLVPGSVLPGHPKIRAHGQQLDGAAIQSILQSEGSIHFSDKGIELSFEALTRSEKDAQSLADVLRFFASMIQMQRENHPGAELMAKSLDGMRLATQGNTMRMSVSLPESAAEQMIDMPKTARRRAAIK
jgi:hypothetical protein